MRYIILEKAEAKVGHVIMVEDGEKAKVTAVGKDGVTARNGEGKKYQVIHEDVEVKGKEKPEKETEGKKPELEVADNEDEKESAEEKTEKRKPAKKQKLSSKDRAKVAEVNPSSKNQ